MKKYFKLLILVIGFTRFYNLCTMAAVFQTHLLLSNYVRSQNQGQISLENFLKPEMLWPILVCFPTFWSTLSNDSQLGLFCVLGNILITFTISFLVLSKLTNPSGPFCCRKQKYNSHSLNRKGNLSSFSHCYILSLLTSPTKNPRTESCGTALEPKPNPIPKPWGWDTPITLHHMMPCIMPVPG